MSEYWVSKKKYFCKYCDIYITDDAPSRQQHENGLRHQGNKNRFIRDLYKTGERKKKDLEEEKREMKRVEAAAQAAYSKDIGTPHAESSSAVSAPPPKAGPSRPAKPADPYANYSTAESLGYLDVEGELLAAQKQIRQKEGRMGEWSVVATPPPPHEPTPLEAPLVTSSVPSDDISSETREWRLDGQKRRKIALGLGDVYDPGVIKVKRREGESETNAAFKEEMKVEESTENFLPSWSARGWKRAGEEAPAAPADPIPGDAVTKLEELPPPSPPPEPEPEEVDEHVVKVEELNVKDTEVKSFQGLFRKRKAPSASASTRGVRRKI